MERKTASDHKAHQSFDESVSPDLKTSLEQRGLNPKELFETFMENSPALAWIAGVDCTLYYMNRMYRTTFDLTNDCLFQKPAIFPPEYLKLYEENNRKVIAENTVLETFEDGYDQSGTYRTFKVFKFPIFTAGGEALIGGWMVDLTSILATENELKKSNDRYFYASKATADVIWEWDVVEKKLFVGAGFQELFGYNEPKDLEGLLGPVCPEDRAMVQENLQQAKNTKALYWQMEYRYRCADGAIKHVLNKAFIVRDSERAPKKAIGVLQDITSYRTLQSQLVKEQEDKKKEVLKAMIQGQEKERSEIGKELHDNVNQLLATAKLLLDTARNFPDSCESYLEKSGETISMALEEIRNLSHALVAPSFEGHKFSEAINELVDRITLTGLIQAELTLPKDSELKELDPFIKLTLYRIIQEQLNNILKHAQAKAIHISIELQKKTIQLVISDDGIGFDPKEKRKGIGLKNIKSRVDMHSGKTRISSAPGQGCSISVTIPLYR